jgi:hypothetical protein
VNAPQTVEGAAVWDLFQRLTGQVRVSRGLITGVEMGTAFQIADALGVNKFVLAEFYPSIEAVIVRSMNEAIRATSNSDNEILGMIEDG